MSAAIDDLVDVETFRTLPLRGQGARVDREANVIYGFAVATRGVVKDRRLEFDQAALEKIVALGNAAPSGIKSRFTHPGMSQDGLGKFLGRSKNFRLDGDVVRADLHLSPRSFDTPHGDLGSYVLDMAETEPDAFGVSIRMPWKAKPRFNPDGTKATDADGKPLPPFADVLGVLATDVVDEPAANNGFFGDLSSPDWPARQAAMVLDQLFSDATADEVRTRVDAFVNRYLQDRGDSMSTPNQDPAVTITTNPNPTPAPVAELAAAKPDQAALAAAREAARAEERQRAKDIRALCAAANFADKADAYIEGDLSVADVREALFTEMCKRNVTLGSDAPAGEPKPKDPDAALKAEFSQFADVARKLGAKEETYLLGAKIQAGESVLV